MKNGGPNSRQTGVIKNWNDQRGFGFITTNDHRDFFLHVRQWLEDSPPRRGEFISFAEDRGRDGRPFARNAMLVTNEQARGNR